MIHTIPHAANVREFDAIRIILNVVDGDVCTETPLSMIVEWERAMHAYSLHMRRTVFREENKANRSLIDENYRALLRLRLPLSHTLCLCHGRSNERTNEEEGDDDDEREENQIYIKWGVELKVFVCNFSLSFS